MIFCRMFDALPICDVGISKMCNSIYIKSHKQNNKQMSKKGSKDKKGENSQALQLMVEEQKREILEQSFTIKQLQDRISRMTEQNYEIVTKRDETQKKYEEKIDDQRVFLESHESTIEKLTKKVESLEVIKFELEAMIKTLNKQLEFSQEVRIREMDEYKRLVGSEMGVLESQLKQYNTYMKERDNLFDQRNKLKNDLETQKQDKLRQVADKEREKVQQTDKLKDEMLMKIRNMKDNLLSLKKQQLSTTTRLAVLQNHQLTSQLEYQSKQTQKLLFQNESLQKKLANMQKDVEIHKQVEEELAKRSHVSKGIIKKLTSKIGELEQQVKRQSQYKQGSESKQSKKKQDFTNQLVKQQEMISILDKTIEQKDRKILKMQADIQILEAENKNLKLKFKDLEKKSLQLSNLLLKYYQQVLDGKIEVKVNENQKDEFILDIRGIKKKPVKQWQIQQCRLIVTILLGQLQPHITKHNLGIPSFNRSQIILTNEQENDSKLPSIILPEHSILKKQSKKFKEVPTSMVPKLVGSNLREWGRTIHSNSVSNLVKKYK